MSEETCSLLPIPCVSQDIPGAQSCSGTSVPQTAGKAQKGRLNGSPIMCWMWKLSVEAFLPQTFFHNPENLGSAGYERSLSFPSSALGWFLTVRFVLVHWLAQPCDLLVV